MSFEQFLTRLNERNDDIHFINGVPFFKQTAHRCGPSALASVLTYYEEDISPESISNEIYIPAKKGTLTLEMLTYPRRFGLVTRMVKSVEDIKDSVRAGFPVILLIDDGWLFYRSLHYILVLGYDEAEEVFLAHWGTEPNKIIRFSSLGKKWESAGRWGFRTERIPESEMTAEQHNDIGVVYEDIMKLDNAEREYLKALQINPDFCEPCFNLGNVYFKKGDLKAAESQYLRALEVCDRKGEVHNNLAFLYLRKKEGKKAREHIQKALLIEPDNPEYLDTMKQIQEAFAE